jgi:hypothetical protein
MDRPAIATQRRLRILAVVVFAAADAAVLRPADATASLPPPPGAVPALSFFVDRKLGDALGSSLEEAARRLSDSRCQELLSDFSDGAGHPLGENLRAIGQSMPGYLGLVLFYDGSGTEPCEAERVMAWTSPGSRAVHVCASQFSRWQRTNPSYAASIVIHETLHTLGLRESPPTPGEITRHVIERCGQ